jgi:hypothetical protein
MIKSRVGHAAGTADMRTSHKALSRYVKGVSCFEEVSPDKTIILKLILTEVEYEDAMNLRARLGEGVTS